MVIGASMVHLASRGMTNGECPTKEVRRANDEPRRKARGSSFRHWWGIRHSSFPRSGSHPHPRLGAVEQVGRAGGGRVRQVVVRGERERRQLVEELLLARVHLVQAVPLQPEGAV